MRVLLTTDTVGGVWDYVVTLSGALAAEGHAVLLAIIGDPTDNQLSCLPEEIAIESRDYRLEWMADSSADVALTTRWLANLGRSWRSDLVHLNQMVYPGAADFGIATLVAVHSDVYSWYSEVRGEAPGPEWRGYLAGVRAGLRRADAVVAPSGYQAALVERFYGRTGVEVIHNATAIAPAAAGPKDRGMIVTVGRAWDEAKGMRTLDRALAILGDQAPEAHLVGSLVGPDGSRFVGESLRCRGRRRRDEVAALMADASIYVAPSLYEPFGLAPLEAALSGCALVLSDIGSFRELWGGCAEFFPRGEARGLAAVVQALTDDPDRRAVLGEAARRRAVERYSVSPFVERYLSLYRRVVGLTSDLPGLAPSIAER